METIPFKRRRIRHLGFCAIWFGTRGSEARILSPRPFFLIEIKAVKQLHQGHQVLQFSVHEDPLISCGDVCEFLGAPQGSSML
jgi:hypothetical protein